MWGARIAGSVGPVAPPVHERSPRAIAMALQSILVRSPYLPSEAEVVELLIDDEPVEIVVGPHPTATVRPAARPDARAAATGEAMADLLRGAHPSEALLHQSGDAHTTQLLIDLLGG